jgi:hypothetical protein
MLTGLINFLAAALFGCSHEHTTFPLSRRYGFRRRDTYIVCLDCGREFRYDWGRMRVGSEIDHVQLVCACNPSRQIAEVEL